MSRITVSAIILDGPRLLLAREPGAAVWALPGGLLEERDETVEDAIARVLAERVALGITEHEFLDTLYEQDVHGVVVHNVFSVGVDVAGLRDATARGAFELQWTHVDELAGAPLASWLGPSLPSLLSEGEAIPPAIDLDGLALSFDERTLPVDTKRLAATRSPVLIITGPAGAGKSTVSRALCQRLPRSGHILADMLRKIVVAGYASPVPGVSDSAEAERQSALTHRNAAALARNLSDAGFCAVIDEVLERPGELDFLIDNLAGYDVAFVTLLPDPRTVAERDAGRAVGRMGQRSTDLHAIIAANGERRGLRLDTSTMSVEETVDRILDHIDEAWVARAWA